MKTFSKKVVNKMNTQILYSVTFPDTLAV